MEQHFLDLIIGRPYSLRVLRDPEEPASQEFDEVLDHTMYSGYVLLVVVILSEHSLNCKDESAPHKLSELICALKLDPIELSLLKEQLLNGLKTGGRGFDRPMNIKWTISTSSGFASKLLEPAGKGFHFLRIKKLTSILEILLSK